MRILCHLDCSTFYMKYYVVANACFLFGLQVMWKNECIINTGCEKEENGEKVEKVRKLVKLPFLTSYMLYQITIS